MQSQIQYEYYELQAMVTDVTKNWGQNKEITFTVTTTKSGQYRCKYTGFLNVQPGDNIYALVKMSGSRELQVMRQPFVQMPVDKDNILQCFIRALRGTGFGSISAQMLYSRVHDLAIASYSKPSNMTTSLSLTAVRDNDVSDKKEGKEETKTVLTGSMGVISYLSEVASNYVNTKDKTLVDALVNGTKLKEEQITKLLMWWHQNRSLRRLHLLGLTNKIIKQCKLSLDEIYKQCLDNPYRLPAIPLSTAESIMRSMGKEPSGQDIICGQMLRFIYDKCEKSGWTATPLYAIAKSFPLFHQNRETLLKDYGLKIEYNMAYLEYPHTVETTLANYFDSLIKDTAKRAHEIKDVANLGQAPQMDTPKLESCMYSQKGLDTEQKMAIQGALEASISLIVGSAGTGKSTIIKEILNNLELRSIPFCVGSFTGKAVSRINQCLKQKIASTQNN